MNKPEKRSLNYPLRRREVVQELLKCREGLLVVAGLGAPAWDATASGDHPLTFPLWGGMGGAVSIGLGLALAQPNQRVLVITGDGEMLMGLGSLSTVGLQQPENLAVVVLDNEHFGETGMQTTHTAASVNLPEIAKASGIPLSWTVRESSEISTTREKLLHAEGPLFCGIKVRAETLPLVLPPKKGEILQKRFRNALMNENGD